MQAELSKWRIALAEHQRQVLLIAGDVEVIEKHLAQIKKDAINEYEKIDEALDKH